MAVSVRKNIVANILGKLWGFVSVFIFVPIYISLLGLESYGVISFYAMLLSFLAFADAGLTATLSREFAKADIECPDYKQNLLRTIEYVYIGIGFFIILLTTIFADTIVANFIKSDVIPFGDLVAHVRIMGIIIFLSLTCSLYQGGLMGLQRQVLSNCISILYNIVRSAVVLIPLIWISDLYFYFYWQLVASILYLFILRYFLLKYIKVNKPIKASINYLKGIWKYALGMMIMAIIASVNTQIDKLVVSKMLTLVDFTNYSLSSMVSQVILFFATPIAIAMFPELTRLISIKADTQAKLFFHKYSFIIAMVSSAIASVLICYAYSYILIWTQDSSIASVIDLPTKVLIVGCLFLSIQFCPYYLSLANGHTRTNIIFGILTIFCVVPMLILFVAKLGLIGATVSWLVINVLATFTLGFILINKFMKGEFTKWLLFDTILPLGVSLAIGFVFWCLFSELPKGLLTILYGLVIFLVIMLINGIIFLKRYPEYKQNKYIKKIVLIRR
ncbi:oligosaccharide flippase family protein [Bacteroides sp.]|uniref:oligosaccharide flippase family protein n=1 Tax=Bacteroides sp. TaxID=29523 RepID=UPI002FC7813F